MLRCRPGVRAGPLHTPPPPPPPRARARPPRARLLRTRAPPGPPASSERHHRSPDPTSALPLAPPVPPVAERQSSPLSPRQSPASLVPFPGGRGGAPGGGERGAGKGRDAVVRSWLGGVCGRLSFCRCFCLSKSKRIRSRSAQLGDLGVGAPGEGRGPRMVSMGLKEVAYTSKGQSKASALKRLAHSPTQRSVLASQDTAPPPLPERSPKLALT